jgi:hypothetical protein
MTSDTERPRDSEHERLVQLFNDATRDLSTYEAGERADLHPESVRRYRNGDWQRLTGDSRRKIVAYLKRRGLLASETDRGLLPSDRDSLYSEAEELIRSFRRFQRLGVFQVEGPDAELRFAHAVVRAAETDGLPDRNPREMAELHRWYASLLDPATPIPSPQEPTADDGSRRASAGSR